MLAGSECVEEGAQVCRPRLVGLVAATGACWKPGRNPWCWRPVCLRKPGDKKGQGKNEGIK